MGTKKRVILVFLTLFLLVAPLAFAKCGQSSFVGRLFQGCKNPGDGVCDDGENILLDSDCSFVSVDDALHQLWLVRLCVIIFAVLAFRKDDKALIVLVVIMALLAMNGAFGDGAIDDGSGSCDVMHIGSCLYPANPLIGWLIVVIVLSVIAIKFYGGRR